MKPVPGSRPVTCCRLHSIEREKARQEEGLQVRRQSHTKTKTKLYKGKDKEKYTIIINFVSKARSKEIRLRLDEERKERIAKRFLTLQ